MRNPVGGIIRVMIISPAVTRDSDFGDDHATMARPTGSGIQVGRCGGTVTRDSDPVAVTDHRPSHES